MIYSKDDVKRILVEIVAILDEAEPEITDDLMQGQDLIDELRKKISEVEEKL